MNELYHYGVKGQKWGVRRYQYADGSLTQPVRNIAMNDQTVETIKQKTL